MIDEVRIDRFRCFGKARLAGVKRVNLVSGGNGSGKTAILESIFLASGGSPELAMRLRYFRSLGDRLAVEMSDVSRTAAIFDDLFYQLDRSNEVSISLRRNESNVRHLRISRNDKSAPIMVKASSKSPTVTSRKLPLDFTWRSESGGHHVVSPEIIDGNLKLNAIPDIIHARFMASTMAVSPSEVAEQFSALSVKNQSGQVVRALNEEYPFVRDVSVEVNMGVPTLFATVDGLSQKIALGMVSAGVNKLTNILVSMSTLQGGFLLLDEIENGFHFSSFPSVWRAIHQFSVLYDVQVFATTHSREFVAAADKLVHDQPDDIAYFRSERHDGSHEVRSFSGNEVLAAVRAGFEIR